MLVMWSFVWGGNCRRKGTRITIRCELSRNINLPGTYKVCCQNERKMTVDRIPVSTVTWFALLNLFVGSGASVVEDVEGVTTEVETLTVSSAYQYVMYTFPVEYDISGTGGVDKIWTMDTQNSEFVVKVTFVQSPMNCETDYVQVRDGISPTSQSLGRWCDGKPRTILSTGTSIRVHFHTPPRTSRSAVYFKYKGDIAPDIITTYAAGITGGLAVGFVVAMTYLAAVIFCLLGKRKYDEKLITMSLVPNTNDHEAVMETRVLGGEASVAEENIRLEVTDRGDNSQHKHKTSTGHSTDRRGFDNLAF